MLPATTLSQSKRTLRLELPLAWYECHVQLENHPRGKCYPGTSQLRILEWIWTWPSVSHLFLVKDSPVNFELRLANIDSHSLNLWTWTISLPLCPLRGCFVHTHQTLAWCGVTFFPAASFLTQIPWPLEPVSSSSSSDMSSCLQPWEPRVVCSLCLECSSSPFLPGRLLHVSAEMPPP